MLSHPVLSHPVQVAYSVDDVHTAAQRWTERGVGPFFVREHIAVDDVRVRGLPGRFDHSSAFAQWGDVMVELICEHSDPVGPTTGVHHMAFFVDDFATATAELVAQGYPQVMAAEAGGMPFAFHDSLDELGHLIEIYEGTPRLREFYAMVAAA